MNKLTFDEFLRSLKQNTDTTNSILLGAGASIDSGIQSATDCIWDWKYNIFITQNPTISNYYRNIKNNNVRVAIQNWIDAQNIYPSMYSDEEYSFFAEKAYPIAEDRRKYFQHLVAGKEPSLGYHLIAMLAEIGWIKSVWTTNFDGLSLKVAHQYNVTPVEVTLETCDRIYRPDTNRELLCVALHGDYKYGPLKNTGEELDTQNDILIRSLQSELSKRNLIVIGYSGRDKSLMSALKEAYSQPGAGRLYWCGYGPDCSPDVQKLLEEINLKGRHAYYISTDGFDKTMLYLSKHCLDSDQLFINRIDSLLDKLGNNSINTTSNFEGIIGNLEKIVKTNLYPINFPSTCYQFKLTYSSNDKPWSICKALLQHDIIAVPYNDLVYAWGEKEKIFTLCSNRIKGSIDISPFSRESVLQNGVFKELLLRAITKILADKNGLSYSKNKIWNSKDPNKMFFYRVNNSPIHAYMGVKLSLEFDNKYTYLSFVPTYQFKDDIKYPKSTIKAISDYFSKKINSTKPNLNINRYLEEWILDLVGQNANKIVFPTESADNFTFTIGANSALIGVNSGVSKNKLTLPAYVNPKRVITNGIECNDSELTFFNVQQNKMVNDYHPMRGLIENSPYDYIINSNTLKSSINVGVLCAKKHSSRFYSFLNELNHRHPVDTNIDYLLPFPGFYNVFNVGLNVPIIDSSEWLDTIGPQNTDIKLAVKEFGETIVRQLEKISSQQTDVVIIYIPKEFDALTSFEDHLENYNLHDFVKAYAAQKRIATQFVREQTLESELKCQVMWTLALALYTKSCRVPWAISGLRKDTAFAGIGYSLNKSKSGSDIIVGCSHIYSSDGQGLKYKLSKLRDYTLENRVNPFLTENEAYKVGLNIKELFYSSFSEIPKRVVVHKRTPFKKEEINGLVKSLSSSGITDIDLLEINFEESIRCFEFSKNFAIDGFPVKRGLCFPVNNHTMLLYTHGATSSIRNSNFKYIQGGKSIPQPLKIVKHYGTSNMSQIATEILGLTKMNWNSFALYSKLPCTLESSNQIARIGNLLSQYEGSIYDYRFFM